MKINTYEGLLEFLKGREEKGEELLKLFKYALDVCGLYGYADGVPEELQYIASNIKPKFGRFSSDEKCFFIAPEDLGAISPSLQLFLILAGVDVTIFNVCAILKDAKSNVQKSE